MKRQHAIIPANITRKRADDDRAEFPGENQRWGTSAVTSSMEEEVDKMIWAIRWGSDTVMGLIYAQYSQHP